MKNLKRLTFTLLLLCSVISTHSQEKKDLKESTPQSYTESENKFVVLDSAQAKAVIKIVENGKTAQKQLSVIQVANAKQGMLIAKLTDQNKSLNETVKQYDDIFKTKDEAYSNLSSLAKKETRNKNFWKIVAIISMTLTGIVAVTN